MVIPYSGDALSNILRLQGLKNVPRKKTVLPGVVDDLYEQESPDMQGLAVPPPIIPQNLPERELGGELTSQSYDVRANSSMPNQEAGQEATPGFWQNLGNSFKNLPNWVDNLNAYESPTAPPTTEDPLKPFLASIKNLNPGFAQTPPIETQQVQEQEDLPPVSASQEEESPGFWASLGEKLKGLPAWVDELNAYESKTPQPPEDLLAIPPVGKMLLGGLVGSKLLPDTLGSAEKQQEWRDFKEDEALRDQGLNPEETKLKASQDFMEGVKKAMENPLQFSVYGSANEVANNPVLQAEFNKITGLKWNQELDNNVSSYEQAVNSVENSLNGIQDQLGEQEDAIKQRILNNEATDQDKYYIGLALLMPLLVGGLFGKEAALGALGGASQGIAEMYGRREKENTEGRASLLDISKEKAGNVEKLADIALNKASIRQKLAKEMPNPDEELLGRREVEWKDPKTGQMEKAVEILPGLVAKKELVQTKEGLKNREKAAEELSDIKSYTETVEDLTNDVIYITSQLQDPSVPYKTFVALLSGRAPGSLAQLTEDVEFEGRKVNAGTLLEQKLGFLANAYARSQQLGQLDRAAQSHMAKLMNNPTGTLATPRDALNQMLEVRKLVQTSLVRNAKNKGFIPEFLQQEMEEKNNALYERLNDIEEKKRVNEVMKKITRSGTTYAK